MNLFVINITSRFILRRLLSKEQGVMLDMLIEGVRHRELSKLSKIIYLKCEMERASKSLPSPKTGWIMLAVTIGFCLKIRGYKIIHH